MVNFVTLDLLTSTTQGNFARTNEWKLVWEIYNLPFQTKKKQKWKSCTNFINGMIFKRGIKLFLKYRIDESCTTLPKVGFVGLKWKIGYF